MSIIHAVYTQDAYRGELRLYCVEAITLTSKGIVRCIDIGKCIGDVSCRGHEGTKLQYRVRAVFEDEGSREEVVEYLVPDQLLLPGLRVLTCCQIDVCVYNVGLDGRLLV